MDRLLPRLILSHLMVAVLGATTTYLLVRVLAPTQFDQQMQRGRGMGGMGQGGALHSQFVSAVDSALLIGVLTGVAVAGVLGAVIAVRLARPLARLGAVTRELATGRYDVVVPRLETRELADLAGDITTLGAALAETEARRTRLLGEVAHEMRTPLTVIDGHVEAMIDGVLPADPRTLAAVTAETRRLGRLADDLSTLSRAEEGRLGLVAARVDLAEVARAAVDRLRPQADDSGISLGWTGDPRVTVEIDVDRISQVITNLVGNALRATPPGGRVDVAVRADAGHATVTVTDTGEGLEEADLERIFERFYRVPGRRRSARETGSGIGLTIARQIAVAHHGTLTAASPGPGQGARFTLQLPTAG